MADKKPLVILTRKLPDSVETRMRELFDAELNDNDEAFSREKLLEAIGRTGPRASTSMTITRHLMPI